MLTLICCFPVLCSNITATHMLSFGQIPSITCLNSAYGRAESVSVILFYLGVPWPTYFLFVEDLNLLGSTQPYQNWYQTILWELDGKVRCHGGKLATHLIVSWSKKCEEHTPLAISPMGLHLPFV